MLLTSQDQVHRELRIQFQMWNGTTTIITVTNKMSTHTSLHRIKIGLKEPNQPWLGQANTHLKITLRIVRKRKRVIPWAVGAGLMLSGMHSYLDQVRMNNKMLGINSNLRMKILILLEQTK